MKKIAIYTGKGAYMAKDVEAFLSDFDIDYSRLNESDVRKGDLRDFDVFVISGGLIFDIIPALKTKGITEIKKFIHDGGKYIGICAGAYIASKKFYNEAGDPQKGMALIDAVFELGDGEKIVQVYFPNGRKIKLFFCNGPLIDKLGNNVEIIAADKSGRIAIIKKKFGKGIIYALSAHPEGNLHNKISAKDLNSELFFKKLLTK